MGNMFIQYPYYTSSHVAYTVDDMTICHWSLHAVYDIRTVYN